MLRSLFNGAFGCGGVIFGRAGSVRWYGVEGVDGTGDPLGVVLTVFGRNSDAIRMRWPSRVDMANRYTSGDKKAISRAGSTMP
jgi:hypothetical protein